MLVVVPEILSMLAGTTVPENDAPAWDKAKAYKAGDRIMQKHYVYQAIKDNTNIEPYANHIGSSGTWQPVGPTNLYKCLDFYNYTQTVAPEGATEMTLVVPWARGNTAFALLNMDAASVTVKIAGLEEYFEKTHVITGAYDSWWDYFFGDWRFQKNLFYTGILPLTATMTITLRGPKPAVGMILIGTQYSFGRLSKGYGQVGYGATVRTVDYSKQEMDAELGTVTYVPRYITGRVSVEMAVHPDDVNYVTNLLGRVKPRPAMWIGDNGTGSDPLNVFGFLKDVSNTYDGPNLNKYSLTIEGIA